LKLIARRQRWAREANATICDGQATLRCRSMLYRICLSACWGGPGLSRSRGC